MEGMDCRRSIRYPLTIASLKADKGGRLPRGVFFCRFVCVCVCLLTGCNILWPLIFAAHCAVRGVLVRPERYRLGLRVLGGGRDGGRVRTVRRDGLPRRHLPLVVRAAGGRLRRLRGVVAGGFRRYAQHTVHVDTGQPGVRWLIVRQRSLCVLRVGMGKETNIRLAPYGGFSLSQLCCLPSR